MNNKRILVIAAVAVLAVILSVAASFVFPRPADSARTMPALGHISYSATPENLRPAHTSGYIHYGASSAIGQPIPVTGRPASDAAQPYQIARQKNIQSEQSLAPYVDSKAKWRNSVEEYIRGQQYRYISPQEEEQRQFAPATHTNATSDSEPGWEYIPGH